jgi:hypothetical protein
MRSWFLALALATAPTAWAGEQSQQPQQPPQQSDEELKKELEKALQQDQANKQQGAQKAPAAATPEAAPAAPPVPTTNATPSSAPQSSRGTQSLNPDISAILDADGGYERRLPAYRSGDDPNLKSGPTSPGAGFTAQEVELAFSAIVDPYFRGDIFLTIPNLQGIEVEEAFATTTSLPWNLQVKMGSFRSAFGRQNGQHLHVQDFTRRPLINDAFLGEDGLRGPGAQVSWLSPLPFYLVFYLEAFSIPTPDQPGANEPIPAVTSFGGGTATQLTYAGEAKYFFPVGESLSVYGGFSAATGISAGYLHPDPVTGVVPGAGRRSEVFGGDLYVKWKPPNVSLTYTSLAWQTELVFRHLEADSFIGDEWDGGMYTQLVLQFARNWFAGARLDFIGMPQSSVVGQTVRGAVSLTWQASEFARVRGYFEVENDSGTGTYQPTAVVASSPGTSYATYLQLEFSIGAHGAHPF